jgi:hypothetical protein
MNSVIARLSSLAPTRARVSLCRNPNDGRDRKNAILEVGAECDKLARRAEDRTTTLGEAGATAGSVRL